MSSCQWTEPQKNFIIQIRIFFITTEGKYKLNLSFKKGVKKSRLFNNWCELLWLLCHGCCCGSRRHPQTRFPCTRSTTESAKLAGRLLNTRRLLVEAFPVVVTAGVILTVWDRTVFRHLRLASWQVTCSTQQGETPAVVKPARSWRMKISCWDAWRHSTRQEVVYFVFHMKAF